MRKDTIAHPSTAAEINICEFASHNEDIFRPNIKVIYCPAWITTNFDTPGRNDVPDTMEIIYFN